MKETVKIVWSFFRRYVLNYLSVIFIVIFVVSYLFIVDNNYMDICKNDEKIRALEKSIAEENKAIQELTESINNYQSDEATIERIAREKYGMQQPHEDVFVVVSDTSQIKVVSATKK